MRAVAKASLLGFLEGNSAHPTDIQPYYSLDDFHLEPTLDQTTWLLQDLAAWGMGTWSKDFALRDDGDE